MAEVPQPDSLKDTPWQPVQPEPGVNASSSPSADAPGDVVDIPADTIVPAVDILIADVASEPTGEVDAQSPASTDTPPPSIEATSPAVVPAETTSSDADVTVETTKEKATEELDVHLSSIASERHPDRNEDATFSLKDKKFFGVLDGVGGHSAGDVASSMAKDFIMNALENLPEELTLKETEQNLLKMLLDAHQHLLDHVKGNIRLSGMGTTASIVKIWEGADGERKAVIANIADSRVYILRADGTLEQVTLDANVSKGDKFENQARELQKILSNVTDLNDLNNDEERFSFKRRNQIDQALGLVDTKGQITPRIYTIDIQDGDKLLVTSDGIHDNLTDTEIAQILTRSANSSQAVDSLINASLKRSRDANHPRRKPDDMSAIVVGLPSSARTAPDTSSVIISIPSREPVVPAGSEPVVEPAAMPPAEPAPTPSAPVTSEPVVPRAEPVRTPEPASSEPMPVPEPESAAVPEPPVAPPEPVEPAPDTETRVKKTAEAEARRHAMDLLNRKYQKTGDAKYLTPQAIDVLSRMILQKYRETT